MISFLQDAIQKLIMERFDKASSAAPAPLSPQATPNTHTNGHPSPPPSKAPKTEHIKTERPIKRETETPISSPPSSHSASPPPKKKRKAAAMDDAQLAAMLQAQENSRTRATRGGASTKRKAPLKKKVKKKSADRIKAADDSDLELDSQGEVKEKVKKGGFHKEYHLSAPLADLVGEAKVCSLYIYFLYF